MALIRALFDTSQPSLFEAPRTLPTEQRIRNQAMFLFYAADTAIRRERREIGGFVPLNRTELTSAHLRVLLPTT